MPVWGSTSWSVGSATYTPLRFPGQYHDTETGLHYNQHRYYDPDGGRYVTPDPLGLCATPHPTAYVPNPWMATDPLGLAPYEVFYRVMSEKDFSRLGPKGEVTPRGENFVTQESDYVTGIADRFARRGGRNAQKCTHLVRYEMQPGTRDALIAAGRGSGDNIAAVRGLAQVRSTASQEHRVLLPCQGRRAVGSCRDRRVRLGERRWSVGYRRPRRSGRWKRRRPGLSGRYGCWTPASGGSRSQRPVRGSVQWGVDSGAVRGSACRGAWRRRRSPHQRHAGFVPFRKLPPWFKRRWVLVTVRNKLESWWPRFGETVEDVWRVLRRRS